MRPLRGACCVAKAFTSTTHLFYDLLDETSEPCARSLPSRACLGADEGEGGEEEG